MKKVYTLALSTLFALSACTRMPDAKEERERPVRDYVYLDAFNGDTMRVSNKDTVNVMNKRIADKAFEEALESKPVKLPPGTTF